VFGVFGIQLLLAFTITAFGVMMSARIQQMQSFMALTQMLVMPLYFLPARCSRPPGCRPGSPCSTAPTR
jgi:hypothetical protein